LHIRFINDKPQKYLQIDYIQVCKMKAVATVFVWHENKFATVAISRYLVCTFGIKPPA